MAREEEVETMVVLEGRRVGYEKVEEEAVCPPPVPPGRPSGMDKVSLYGLALPSLDVP